LGLFELPRAAVGFELVELWLETARGIATPRATTAAAAPTSAWGRLYQRLARLDSIATGVSGACPACVGAAALISEPAVLVPARRASATTLAFVAAEAGATGAETSVIASRSEPSRSAQVPQRAR